MAERAECYKKQLSMQFDKLFSPESEMMCA